MSERRGRFYEIPALERDRRIVEYKRAGWPNTRIARAVGMSESGVRRALERIRGGGFGEGATRG
jgi:DNA-binding Lrp family transcriptional regulator